MSGLSVENRKHPFIAESVNTAFGSCGRSTVACDIFGAKLLVAAAENVRRHAVNNISDTFYNRDKYKQNVSHNYKC